MIRASRFIFPATLCLTSLFGANAQLGLDSVLSTVIHHNSNVTSSNNLLGTNAVTSNLLNLDGSAHVNTEATESHEHHAATSLVSNLVESLTEQTIASPSGLTEHLMVSNILSNLTESLSEASMLNSEHVATLGPVSTVTGAILPVTEVAAPVAGVVAPLVADVSNLLPTQMTDIHFIAGDNLSDAYIGHHHCSSVEDLMQCAIYDGSDAGAKLRAVEHIVPASVFETFSDAEKALWHSHAFAIESGILRLPGLSLLDELPILQTLLGTYGKVTDSFHPGKDLPTGNAQVAFGLTSQSQVDLLSNLISQLDAGQDVSYLQRAVARQALNLPEAVAGQDPYHETGMVPQYVHEMYAVNKNSGNPQ